MTLVEDKFELAEDAEDADNANELSEESELGLGAEAWMILESSRNRAINPD